MPYEFGNALAAGADTRGWIVGSFIDGASPRNEHALQVKWGSHCAGDHSDWKATRGEKNLALLVTGHFIMHLGGPKSTLDFVFQKPGDYLIWDGACPHKWLSVSDAVLITVRWPSSAIFDNKCFHKMKGES